MATRKAPNAFNFIRQTQVLQRAQSTAVANMASCLHPAQELLKDVQSLSDLQDWSKHADIAKAFQIGKFEAGAVSNLMSNVSEPVRLMVTADVRTRGMRTLISHEALAKDILNRGFSSGREKLEAWSVPLTNCQDDTLATRLSVV